MVALRDFLHSTSEGKQNAPQMSFALSTVWFDSPNILQNLARLCSNVVDRCVCVGGPHEGNDQEADEVSESGGSCTWSCPEGITGCQQLPTFHICSLHGAFAEETTYVHPHGFPFHASATCRWALDLVVKTDRFLLPQGQHAKHKGLPSTPSASSSVVTMLK